MIGLYQPAAGHIFIGGKDIVTAEEMSAPVFRKSIGVTYQMGALSGSMTLLEMSGCPEEYTALPSDAMDLIARMKLKLVGLETFLDYMPSELSGGMQKRAVSRAPWRLTRTFSFWMSRLRDSGPDYLGRTRPTDSRPRPQSRDHVRHRHT